jgi:uncharacterized protein (TIRG00374 family)
MARRRVAGAGPRLAILSVVAALTLWLAFRHFDAAALRAALLNANLGWMGAALGGVAAAWAFAVFRWRILFHPQRPHTGRLAGALIVGQMANVILPLRLGELARVALVSRTERVAATRVLATIALERLGDVVMLGIGTAVVLLTMPVPDWMEQPGRAVVVIAGVSLAATLALAWQPEALLRAALRLSRSAPARVRGRVQRLAADAIDGVRALGSRRRMFAFWLLSIACFLSAASVNYLMFRAFHLALPASVAVLLLVVLQAGNTAVSVPGNLGVFHYLTMLVLVAWGVPRDAALAFAIALYAIALLPKIVVGAAILAAGPFGWTFASVFRRGEMMAR